MSSKPENISKSLGYKQEPPKKDPPPPKKDEDNKKKKITIFSPIITSTLRHLPPPATPILAPLCFSLNHTHLLHSHSSSAPFSSLSYLPFPANLSIPQAPSFFNCSIHSSADHRPASESSALCFLHYLSPTSRVGRMAGLLVNRHKLIPMMGQYRSSDDHVSDGNRVGPRPVATATAMQCGGRKPDDAVLEEATVALMSQDNRGCTMALGMTVFYPMLSSPPKSPPWPSGAANFHIPLFTHPSRERKIYDGGLCCGSFGAVESIKNQHLENQQPDPFN